MAYASQGQDTTREEQGLWLMWVKTAFVFCETLKMDQTSLLGDTICLIQLTGNTWSPTPSGTLCLHKVDRRLWPDINTKQQDADGNNAKVKASKCWWVMSRCLHPLFIRIFWSTVRNMNRMLPGCKCNETAISYLCLLQDSGAAGMLPTGRHPTPNWKSRPAVQGPDAGVQ